MGQHRHFFVHFRSLQSIFFVLKTLGFSGIRTGMVGVEVGHYATTTAEVQHGLEGHFVCVPYISQPADVRIRPF